ncbi:MAG: hypothetical protein ACP5P9_08975 [Acidimicrobiales bacterium]
MSANVEDVLAHVVARVDYLRASTGDPPVDEDGWLDCDRIGVADLASAVDDAVDGGGSTGSGDRQVAASLLVQSYAHRVVAVSLAAFAVGLPWPSPAAETTSVRVVGGRARALRFRAGTLGDADSVASLVDAAFGAHLVPFVSTVLTVQRLGERLVWANVAASCAAAFRAVEGAARHRGDAAEAALVRRRAADLVDQVPWLAGTGWFDADREWRWQRSACCLWYRTSKGRTCEGCSLRRQVEP